MSAPSYIARVSALLFTLAAVIAAAQSPTVQPDLLPVKERKPAIDFALKDTSNKIASLKEYRGKVVLLDFWATWCTGCKEEIPFFLEFQRTYGAKGFAVVGVSLDDVIYTAGDPHGWDVVKPFLKKTHLSYRMLLADDPAWKRYGMQQLPDTFLIDRQGRVAAAYLGRLVDKDDVEAKIKALLSEQ